MLPAKNGAMLLTSNLGNVSLWELDCELVTYIFEITESCIRFFSDKLIRDTSFKQP